MTVRNVRGPYCRGSVGQAGLRILNKCPHDGVNLDWERNQFFDPNGIRLMCGKHGALFELGTGQCLEGPCKGRGLTPVALTILDGDICVTGVTLVADEDEVLTDEAEA